ncbi:hypothetical protein [Streptomyces sp. NPDC001744]|uniref:hypothetical protein n=1 Tax=Streptomyces sp. NPDC001744 TaxID=3364606 RepID=UPI0036CD9612
MLLIGWAALTAVEWRAERASWSTAVTSGFLWACVAAGTWWFAEMTQGPSSRTDRKDGRVRALPRRRVGRKDAARGSGRLPSR